MAQKPGNNFSQKLKFNWCLIGFLFLAGCGEQELSTEELVFTSLPDLNNGRTFLVNIVLVKDKETFQKIGNLDNKQYFEQFEQLKNDNNLFIYEYDIMPGKKNTVQPPIWKGSFFGGFVFARVTDEGLFRAVLPNKTVVQINIEANKISVDQTKDSSVLGNLSNYFNNDKAQKISESIKNNELLNQAKGNE